MLRWPLSDDVLPQVAPSFAPVFDFETRSLKAGGRTRRSSRLEAMKCLSSGSVRADADFHKSFRCSWSRSQLHPCPAALRVLICSSHLLDKHRTNVDVQCVWSAGCRHHKNDVDRGVVRAVMINSGSDKTPHGLCHEHIKRVTPMAMASGNRSYGFTTTETARRAQYVRRKKVFDMGNSVVETICVTARELAMQDMLRDPSGCLPFYPTEGRRVFVLKILQSTAPPTRGEPYQNRGLARHIQYLTARLSDLILLAGSRRAFVIAANHFRDETSPSPTPRTGSRPFSTRCQSAYSCNGGHLAKGQERHCAAQEKLFTGDKTDREDTAELPLADQKVLGKVLEAYATRMLGASERFAKPTTVSVLRPGFFRM